MFRLRDPKVALAALTLFTLLAGDAWRYLISWYGWGVIVALLLVGWIAVAVHRRIDLRRIPISLGAFLSIVTTSLAWSHYPAASAIGISTTLATVFVGVVMAHTLSLANLLRSLSVALRWVLGLSLVFELAVEVLIGRPVLPLWVDYDGVIPRAFFWSRSLLFDGGRIQGIPGNSNLLGFAALLAAIVFSIQLAESRVSRAAGIGWLTTAIAVLLLTRSSTVLIASIGAIFAVVIVLVARRLSSQGRAVLAAGTFALLIAGASLAVVFRSPLLTLLGRSDDLTGRVEIWDRVLQLVAQRPVQGWGWVSYWAPWVDPYDDLVVLRGVRYLQAHSAWLDVLLQVGILGIVVFGILVATTTMRVLSWSIDPYLDGSPMPAVLRLLPVALLASLVVQSIAESRLIIEAGLVLLVYLCVSSRLRGRTLR
jgi:O-antigen ligase